MAEDLNDREKLLEWIRLASTFFAAIGVMVLLYGIAIAFTPEKYLSIALAGCAAGVGGLLIHGGHRLYKVFYEMEK